MNTNNLEKFKIGARIDWNEATVDLEAWRGFITYAGQGPFTILGVHQAPCTCGMETLDSTQHAPGCLFDTELDPYLTLLKPGGRSVMSVNGKKLILISAKFFKTTI